MTRRHRIGRAGLATGLAAWALAASAYPAGPVFHFPTDNQALLTPGREEEFFVGTVGRGWESGSFGCVRSEGYQFHEGLDIRATSRDARNEPTDAIYATAAGEVAYANRRAALSTFGKYLILRHRIEGIEIYSTYAHLSEIRKDLEAGTKVRAREPIGVMGRTSNTSQRISKERAHVHFEINLKVSDRFEDWHRKAYRGGVNDHGEWNGRNFVGVDPAELLRESHAPGEASFQLLEFLRNRTELCRVVVRETRFSWLERHAPLIRRNPTAEREGAAGVEIVLDYAGVPFLVIPRAASEIDRAERIHLLSVEEDVYDRHPCRKLVRRRGGDWELRREGERFLELLLF